MSKKILPKWTAGNLVKIWCPDAPPETPSAYDDEFNDETFNTNKWTEYDYASLIDISEEKQGVKMFLSEMPTAAEIVSGIYQLIPEGDFTISTRVHIQSNKGEFNLAGLMLYEDGDDSSKDLYGLCLYRGNVMKLSLERYTSYNTPVADLINLTIDPVTNQMYFRIRRNNTTYYFEASNNGLGFTTFYKSYSLLFVTKHFGLFIDSKNHSGGQPDSTSAIFSFFRYQNSDIGLTSPLEGRLLNVKTF
jgi:hypothetical protein